MAFWINHLCLSSNRQNIKSLQRMTGANGGMGFDAADRGRPVRSSAEDRRFPGNRRWSFGLACPGILPHQRKLKLELQHSAVPR